MPTSASTSMYLDSSALVKIIGEEDESAALRAAIDGSSIVSCNLARTEVIRAARQKSALVVTTARKLLAQIDLIQLDDELLDLAGELDGPLRSLDAIHLAAALELGEELEAVVTYDVRMTRAAEALGLRVAAPA
ncbi:MAG: type II toxin-antitoxin system VapC family toxin [Gaiellaceae bacterium]